MRMKAVPKPTTAASTCGVMDVVNLPLLCTQLVRNSTIAIRNRSKIGLET